MCEGGLVGALGPEIGLIKVPSGASLEESPIPHAGGRRMEWSGRRKSNATLYSGQVEDGDEKLGCNMETRSAQHSRRVKQST